MNKINDFFVKDNYFKIAANEYKKFRNTLEWDENYKWDVLSELNKKMSLKEINAENIVEKIKILQKYNPNQGPLVHWTELDNLLKIAEKNPNDVLTFLNILLDEKIPLADRIENARNILKEEYKCNFGISLFAYVLASFDMQKYPVYKNNVFNDFLEILGKKWDKKEGLGKKYEKYIEVCNNISDFLKDTDTIINPNVMDGQDFIYTITQYKSLKYQIASSLFKIGYEKWYINSEHSQNPLKIYNEIEEQKIRLLNREEFIDFFYNFVKNGGKIQSGGSRIAPKFKEFIENNYDHFRDHVMEVFSNEFDVITWFNKGNNFKNFGKGSRSIYLHEVFPEKYLIWNNKTKRGLELLGLLPKRKHGTSDGEYYLQILEVERELEKLDEKYDLYVIDAMMHFIVELLPKIEEIENIYVDIIRTSCKNNGIGLSIEDWEEIITDANITKDEDFEILRLVYENEDHEITASEIAKKLNKPHHGVINLEVSRFSKRIVQKMGITPPPYKKGEGINWWNVPFMGDDKKTRYFPWIMRPELVKAFENIIVHSPSKPSITMLYGNCHESLKFDPNNEIIPNLYFEDEKHLIGQIITAINSGKHIILIGPPGTGKSKLAKGICESMRHEDNYLMVTACSDWSTFDTIGGYMPNKENRLEFDKGIFLSCFQNKDGLPANKWLILDEINRSDIDKAFGALFSALTGDRIQISQFIKGERIEVIGDPKDDDKVLPHRFFIHPDWRIIATMNTFDKASLYEMSYAFMRRFAFINVGIPEDIPKAVKELFSIWDIQTNDEDTVNKVASLWAAINKYRRIGPAIINDIAKCVSAGGSYGSSLAMYVLPQFEGLMQEDQISFINELKTSGLIKGKEYEELQKLASDFFGFKIGKFDHDENK